MKDIKEIEQKIMSYSSYDQAEKRKIFELIFKNWEKDHGYIYQRFDIKFEEEILDIGSSYGGNLINFSNKSLGVEINSKVADFAKYLDLNIISLNAEDDLNNIEQRFDLIWSTDFLVHMISPYKFLYDSRFLLKDKGRLVIQIPLLSIFNTHRSPCHFYAFNKKGLCYLMEMAGYKVIKTSGYIRRLPNWLNFVFEPLLQLFGGNIWVLAVKENDKVFNPEKVFLPKWFKI